MEFDTQVNKMLHAATCQDEFNKYQLCFATAKRKSDFELCRETYKRFQFCIVERETVRLETGETWEKFKTKWGHYPHEQDNYNKNGTSQEL